MKKLAVLLIAALLAPAAIAFGVGSGPANPLDRYIAQLSEDLNLTPDQQERIRPVLAATAANKMSDLAERNGVNLEDDSLDGVEGQEELQDQHLRANIERNVSGPRGTLADILTPQQLSKYNKMQREEKARIHELVRSRRYQ
ncbi:MAG: hypothetical protein AB8C02_16130 [Halioglobus sp.]